MCADFNEGYLNLLFNFSTFSFTKDSSISVMCPCLTEEVISNNVQLMLYSSCSLVYGMVPFLNAILGTMLPMLSMAKQDNMKWVFSSGKKLHDVHFEL